MECPGIWVGLGHNCGTGLYGELRIAFQNLHLDLWALTLFPEGSSRPDTVAESASIRAIAAFDGTGNANEFRLEELARGVDNGVAVASHVDKRHVRRQIWIGSLARLRDVSATRILETRAHAVANEHVQCGLRSVIDGPLPNIERSQRMVLGKRVFQSFDDSWS